MRRIPCRKCGKPNPDALCPECSAKKRSASYGAVDYVLNSRLVRNEARRLILNGHIVLCCICKRQIRRAEEVTCEHITPVRDGGSNELANMAAAHSKCNYGRRRYATA